MMIVQPMIVRPMMVVRLSGHPLIWDSLKGARRAFARAKVHWGKLDAEKLITDAPPAGKEYRTPEMYYKTVLKGARKIADECPRDVIIE